MTESEEQAIIHYECQKFQDRINEINKKLKILQVKGFKIHLEHPSPTKIKNWWQFWK